MAGVHTANDLVLLEKGGYSKDLLFSAVGGIRGQTRRDEPHLSES
jgi:hypothetical protein